MSKSKQEFRQIKHNIISMGNPLHGAIALFNCESEDTILKHSNALCKESFFRNAVVGKCFPSTVADMGKCGNLPQFNNLRKTLGWYVLGLCAKSKEIQEFLSLREQFDYAYLGGQYDQCLVLLELSRQKFGRSFWEIKSQIAVLSEKEGLESQRKYANRVLDEMPKGGLEAYLVYSFSKQCERTVSVGTFLNMLERDYERFVKNGVIDVVSKYLYYKALGNLLSVEENRWLIDGNMINAFLYIDDKYSLIDRYISFCSIIANVFEYGDITLQELFFPYIKKLNAEFNDPFIKNIVSQYEKKFCYFHSASNERICQAFDLYSVGEYEACIQQTGDLLRESVINFPLVELYAKCCINLPEYIPVTIERSPLNTIVRKLTQLFARKGDAKDLQTDLMKVLYTHLHTSWSWELFLIIEKFSTGLMVLEENRTANYYVAVTVPSRIFDFDSAFLNNFLATATGRYRDSVSTQLAIALRTNDLALLESLDLEAIRTEKYRARLLAETDPADALIVLDQLRTSGKITSAVKLEIDALRVRVHLRMDNLLGAIEIFVPAFCENSNFIYAGAIDQIFAAIKAGTHDVGSSILTPIVCSLYFNYYPNHNDIDDIVLCASYEDYLDSCGVAKPSDLLANPPAGVSAAIFNRFLAEVCVPGVMARSLAFETEDDILRERNIICNALADRDEENRDKYIAEMRRHTNTLLVRLAKREIDNGKVYVDIEAIRTLLRQDVCESFERYLEYRNNDLQDFIIGIANNPANSTGEHIYIYQSVNQTGLLEDAVKQARDIFTADNKYGLDGTLSVRIRHGTLESQLRSCFEKHNLITTKAVDGNYNPNLQWNNGRRRSTEEEKEIQAIFKSFSASIDEQIAIIKNELIQIRTEEKNPAGVFNFTIDSDMISVIDAKMYWIDSYQAFETFIMDMMLDITNICLEKMRDLLEREINDIFQQRLRELETSLQKYSLILNFQALRDHIAKARTDISAELKNVADWFRRTQSDDFRDYDLSLAAQLSLQTFQHSHPAFTLKCNYDDIDKSIELRGRTLRSVVDIFIILLDNVMKHSGFNSNVSVQISAKRENSTVFLSVKNPVKPGTISDARLKEITNHLSNWENSGYIRREGGSGIHKIKKILSVDLQCNNTINLSCDNDTFIADICAELGGVMR